MVTHMDMACAWMDVRYSVRSLLECLHSEGDASDEACPTDRDNDSMTIRDLFKNLNA